MDFSISELFTYNELIYFVRIVLACICGALIGAERQRRVKVAGLKTHIIISMAAALMMIISKYGFMDVITINGLTCDVSRVAAGIITGVGILSGGIIFIGKRGNVSGITTAAGIWATIGIGMAIGAGMYVLGIGCVVIVEVLQLILHANLKIYRRPTIVAAKFDIEDKSESMYKLLDNLKEKNISIYQLKWGVKSKNSAVMSCTLSFPKQYSSEEVLDMLSGLNHIESFEII